MIRATAFSIWLGASVVCAAGARADDADFFKGKNITVLIGYAAGGTYDATARLLSRHMARHIPGNPNIIAQNLPGSGGIKAILNLYSVSPRDGTALGMLARSYAIEPSFNPQLAKYDPGRFNPIGSTSKEVSVGVVWHSRGVKSFEDLQTQQITAGATGVTDDTGRFPTLIHKLTGAKIKVVTGYPGGNDVTMAMERGEVDARIGWSWGSLKSRSKPWLDEKKVNVLIQMALQKAQDLPDVPLIMDFAKTDVDRKALEMLFSPQISAWPLIAPPDVPEGRIAILRRAFDATMKDPAFLADAEKMQIEIDPVSGETMQDVVTRIATFDRSVIDRALELTQAR
ncbi:MAG: tripartite tricarboxylate transporter substrate-binding protein [Beijerinckiaceae bacterium]|nr:tripartite tricarboxylate transporter substrate-binding protein [Beijerinckiaceae bacterium]